MNRDSVLIHPSAVVSDLAMVGAGTHIWNYSYIRGNARVGRDCLLGNDVFVDSDVVIDDRVKIQTGAHLYRGTKIDAGVTIGPGVIFASEQGLPEGDWGKIRVCYGASIGAGAVILPNVVVGRFSVVEPGAVVTQNVPDHALVMGSPAHVTGYVCRCGAELREAKSGAYLCVKCGEQYRLVPDDTTPLVSLFMPRRQFRAVQQRWSSGLGNRVLSPTGD